MKVITKICIMVSGIFFLIGVLCLSIGIAMGVNPSQLLHHSFNFDYFFTSNTTTPLEDSTINESYSYTDIDSLDLDLNLCELTIYQQEGEKLSLTATNTGSYFTCIQNDDQLIIKDNRPSSSKQNSMKNALKLALYLPTKEIEDISIKVEVGEVSIDKLTAEHIELSCDVGNLWAKELSCEDLGLSSGVGEIEIEHLLSEDSATIETGTGNLSLHQYQGSSLNINCGIGETIVTAIGTETDYDYSLDAGMGEIYINHYRHESTQSSDYDKHLEKNQNANQDIQIQNGLGSIYLTFTEESL